MKTKKILVTLGLAVNMALSTLHAAEANAGFVDFGSFSEKETGKEFVEVNISSNIIGLVAQLAKEEPEALEVLKGLKGIRVNVFKLTEENREQVKARVDKIRGFLKENKWETLVTANKDHHDVNVSVKTRGADAIEGLVVTVVEGNNQVVLVNIIGDINPEKIATLGQRFNIDPLKELAPRRASKS